jgi:hypothetical protein
MQRNAAQRSAAQYPQRNIAHIQRNLAHIQRSATLSSAAHYSAA